MLEADEDTNGIDFDPREEKLRNLGHEMQDLLTAERSRFEDWLELRRDDGLWSGTLTEGKYLAARMANNALRPFMPEGNFPDNFKLYFDVGSDNASQVREAARLALNLLTGGSRDIEDAQKARAIVIEKLVKVLGE